jgi:putative transposase
VRYWNAPTEVVHLLGYDYPVFRRTKCGWKARETRRYRLKLRQVEVLQGQGNSVSEAVRQIGVTVQTYYRWRKEYGGMSRDQLKRLKDLETENQRLKRVVADLSLDKMILTEAARGNF